MTNHKILPPLPLPAMYLLPQICARLGVQLALRPLPAGEVQLPHLQEAFAIHVDSTEGVDAVVVTE